MLDYWTHWESNEETKGKKGENESIDVTEDQSNIDEANNILKSQENILGKILCKKWRTHV